MIYYLLEKGRRDLEDSECTWVMAPMKNSAKALLPFFHSEISINSYFINIYSKTRSPSAIR